MAIKLIYYNVIIPRANIERVFPGGFNALLKYHEEKGSIGRIWYDEYLYRDGAMSPGDTETIGRYWEKLGLKLVEKKEDKDHWKDICVVDFVSGPTLPCEWLVFERDKNTYPGSIVYHRDKPRGEVIDKYVNKGYEQKSKNKSSIFARLFRRKKLG